ncbi:hypothetical protein B0H19DRAFT_1256310 [Mycena capillaripes]|nr:hypothetical protein B0H19DRAFT_1256310 [Mycena capillaripes]
MGLLPRTTKAQKAKLADRSTLRPALVPSPSLPHPLQRKKNQPLVFGPHNHTLVQTMLPPLYIPEDDAEDTLASDLPDIIDSVFTDAGDRDADADEDDRPSPQKRQRAARSPEKRHRVARASQTEVWMEKIIPVLVPVFMDLFQKTRSWREMDVLSAPNARRTCSCSRPGALLKVAVLTFTNIYDLEIFPCDCWTAPLQLLERGLFPSAPLRPGLAVDVRLLEFTMKLFVRIAPNKSAMVGALEEHLRDLGFKLPSDDGMRRQLSASLEWYTHLRHRVDAHVDEVIETTRKYTTSLPSDAADFPPSTPGGTTSTPPQTPPQSPRPQSAPFLNRGRVRGVRAVPQSSPTPATPRGQKRSRADSPRERPSEYLRARCPACFGGDFKKRGLTDIKVCLDACFTHRKKASVPDPPKTHPHTHFVPEEQSEQMENYVDAVRGTDKPKPKKARVDEVEDEEDDGYEHPDLLLPRSVLNSCEASFTAADEKRAKTSTKGYDNTALMALLCRHDRVLWIVNMHSAGEKQFPALLLIETLYQHLPLWVIVGLLYDIACQLERSARKWGFLDRYLDRLIFAVAVFHAFGHDWPCQLLYHPRKRQGFGFTNGEGCERFWHSISHLIAHLRISSYHHRLYTLDTQVKHCDEGNLFRLGEWNKRRALHSAEKRAAAKEVIEKCGVALEVLKEEWEKQVAAQTKPLPRRSKNMAKKAIEVVMSLRDAVGIRKAQQTECRAAALDAIEAGDSVLIQETKEEQKKAETELAKVERQLDRKERALGVKEKAQLADLKATRVERSARRQLASEKKLGSHTRSAIKKREPSISKLYKDYNKACTEIAKLIKRKAAPQSAIAPEPIDEKKVWELDVDDAIWQDVGLDDDDDEGDTPIWLSDDNVRKCHSQDLSVHYH